MAASADGVGGAPPPQLDAPELQDDEHKRVHAAAEPPSPARASTPDREAAAEDESGDAGVDRAASASAAAAASGEGLLAESEPAVERSVVHTVVHVEVAGFSAKPGLSDAQASSWRHEFPVARRVDRSTSASASGSASAGAQRELHATPTGRGFDLVAPARASKSIFHFDGGGAW